MSASVDQFIGACSQIAQKLRLPHVLISVQDPTTGECKTVMSAGSEILRDSVAEKLGLATGALGEAEAETGWADGF